MYTITEICKKIMCKAICTLYSQKNKELKTDIP